MYKQEVLHHELVSLVTFVALIPLHHDSGRPSLKHWISGAGALLSVTGRVLNAQTHPVERLGS